LNAVEVCGMWLNGGIFQQNRLTRVMLVNCFAFGATLKRLD
jgi:hypothetical protein